MQAYRSQLCPKSTGVCPAAAAPVHGHIMLASFSVEIPPKPMQFLPFIIVSTTSTLAAMLDDL